MMHAYICISIHAYIHYAFEKERIFNHSQKIWLPIVIIESLLYCIVLSNYCTMQYKTIRLYVALLYVALLYVALLYVADDIMQKMVKCSFL